MGELDEKKEKKIKRTPKKTSIGPIYLNGGMLQQHHSGQVTPAQEPTAVYVRYQNLLEVVVVNSIFFQ